MPPELATQVIAQRPEWAGFSASELAGAFAVQQFLAFFLLMPAYIPLSIATFSIIGEKQARTLEPVLATPIRTVELLTRQGDRRARAGRPGRLGHVRRVRAAGVARLRAAPLRGRDRRELAGRRLRPGTGGRAVSVVAGVIVSSRVNDPRVAQQVGGIIIMPIIAITLLQATGTLLVGAAGYLLLAAIILVVSLIGLRAGVALFDREAILTRWR